MQAFRAPFGRHSPCSFAALMFATSLRWLSPAVVLAAPAASAQSGSSKEEQLARAQRQIDEGQALKKQRKFAEARLLFESALHTREALLEPNHLLVAESLQRIIGIYFYTNQFASAIPLLERELQIRSAAGENRLDVAEVLERLGGAHATKGEYEQALKIYERSLKIRETVQGPNSPDLARALVNYSGQVYDAQLDLPRLRQVYARALKILEAAVPPDPARTAQILRGCANNEVLAGNFAAAEELLQRAQAMFAASSGESSYFYLTNLRQLAGVAGAQGDYERAIALLQRCLRGLDALKPENEVDRRDYQSELRGTLGMLAQAYIERAGTDRSSDLRRAEALLNRSIAILPTLGSAAGSLVSNLDSLAQIYALSGDRTRAIKLLEGALAGSKDDGASASEVFYAKERLADLLRFEGRLDEAARLAQQTLTQRESILGPSHHELVVSLQVLAQVRAAQGRTEDAADYLQRALALTESRLTKEGLVLSERRMEQLLALLRHQEDLLYALLLRDSQNRDGHGSARLRRLALATLLLRKGRAVDELALTSLIQSQIPEGPVSGVGKSDVSDRQRFDALRDLRSRLSYIGLAGSEQLEPERRQALFKDLADRAETIEQELAKRIAPLRTRRQLPTLDRIVPEVAAALAPDTALVELVAFRESGPNQAVAGALRYLAFVLGHDGESTLVDLGDAAPIEQTVARLLAAVGDSRSAYQEAAREGYRRLFAPLVPALGARRKVVLSADGLLNLVPFATLLDGQKFLLDSYEINYVTSGRSVLSRDAGFVHATGVVALADPSFRKTAAAAPRDRAVLLGNLTPLPGTRQEAEAIKKLWPQAQLLLGDAASKPALLGLRAPAILHIATHGLFMSDPAQPAASQARGFDVVDAPPPPNPLLRSALVLAGAQDSSGAAAGARLEADGLATALEVSSMNLWGTQLVVLSACDSGRGDVPRGQGVYGLRRALQAAGAETLVTSLWRISDRVTAELMSAYYQRLHRGEGRVAALRAAAQEVRAQHAHPYYWASFIAIGRDAPLQEVR